ncbi:hypothetical protein V6N13_040777 [Hibiscus sabdariffa]|uniref:Carbohydrate kinase PfkB domain-containing protein n=1 Tax=Hibiscus sabdariffa TaxID=183260 RepID=A0ABR2RA43_9ROSI
MLADILKQNGVSDDGILFDQDTRTALAFVALRADGEREFMFYRNPSQSVSLWVDKFDRGNRSGQRSRRIALLRSKPSPAALVVGRRTTMLGSRSCPSGTRPISSRNSMGAVDAFHVNTVDTTGAGESFVGALLCKIVDDPSRRFRPKPTPLP